MLDLTWTTSNIPVSIKGRAEFQIFPETDTVAITIPKEQCPQTWLHAPFLGYCSFGMVTVTTSAPGYRVPPKEYVVKM